MTKRGSGDVRKVACTSWDEHDARRRLRVVVADQWIAIVDQPAEGRIVYPGLLDKLKLALDAGVGAKKVDAARLSVILQVQNGLQRFGLVQRCQHSGIEQRRSIRLSPPQDAMARRHVQRFDRAGRANLIARVRPPDVRAKRTRQPIRIAFA